jgi:hypothetical protein
MQLFGLVVLEEKILFCLLTNHKQELPVKAIFNIRSTQNGEFCRGSSNHNSYKIFRPRKLELNKRGNNINAQSISGNILENKRPIINRFWVFGIL